MLQYVDGHYVYVVELETLPCTPIVGTGIEQSYAQALTTAIRDGVITKPGKYAIELNFMSGNGTIPWHVYEVQES